MRSYFITSGVWPSLETSINGCTLMRTIRCRLRASSFAPAFRLVSAGSVCGRIANHVFKLLAPLQKRDEDAHKVVRLCYCFAHLFCSVIEHLHLIMHELGVNFDPVVD